MMRPALTLPLLLTTACGAVPGTDSYSCGGLPVGVSCISARDTYKLTDGGKPVVAMAGKATALDAPPAAQSQATAPAAAGTAPIAASPAPGPAMGNPAGLPPGFETIALRPEDAGAPDVIPLRTPAVVLRIWMAPWEDTDGRLHVPGYTYAEIEPRRWTIGQDEPTRGRRLQPLRTAPPLQAPVPPPPPQDTGNSPTVEAGAGQAPIPRRQRNPPPLPRSARDGQAQDASFGDPALPSPTP